MTEQKKQYQVFALIGIFFFIGIILVLLGNLSIRQVLRQKAAGERVVVSVSPAVKTVSPGEAVDVTVSATASTPVSLITSSVSLAYPAELVDIADLSCGGVFTDLVKTAQNGTVSLDCYIAQTATTSVHTLTAGESVLIGRFRMTVKNTAPVGSVINLNLNEVAAIDPVIVSNEETNVADAKVSAVYTVSGGAVIGPVTVYLNPESGTLTKGADNRINVVLSTTETVNITGGDIKIYYDISKLDTDLGTVANPVCADGLNGNNDIASGRINLVCFKLGELIRVSTGSPYVLGSFILRVKETASGTVDLTFGNSIVANESQINYVGTTRPASYTIRDGTIPTVTPSAAPIPTNTPRPSSTPAPTNTPRLTSTPTPPPAGTPVLTFSIRSQGIMAERANQLVKVRIKKGSFDKTFTNVSLTADDQGVYSGRVVLDGVAPGTGYSVFVKGPRHLAKKLCENNQAKDKRCGDVEAITLVSGNNAYNWSSVVMEGGDLPLTNGQDGVVNSVDWTYMNGKLGSSAAADLTVADINLDGVVNATDRVLLRITLETKYEEDY